MRTPELRCPTVAARSMVGRAGCRRASHAAALRVDTLRIVGGEVPRSVWTATKRQVGLACLLAMGCAGSCRSSRPASGTDAPAMMDASPRKDLAAGDTLAERVPPGCVPSWPSAGIAERRAPKAVKPQVVWSRIGSTAPFGGPSGVLKVAASKGIVAVVSANTLLILDYFGAVLAQVTIPGYSKPSQPAFDVDGNILVAAPGAAKSFGADGAARWTRAFGSPKLASHEATGTQFLIDHAGRGFVSSNDGYLYAFRASDGLDHWKARVADFVNPLPLYLGVGDALFHLAGTYPSYTRAYSAAAGAIIGDQQTPGELSHVVTLALSMPRLVGTISDDRDRSQGWRGRGIFVLDRCGSLQWETGLGRYREPILVGYDDNIVAREIAIGVADYERSFAIVVYSSDGSVIAGPSPPLGTPIAIGADDTIYSILCENYGRLNEIGTLIATKPTLDEKWRLSLNGSCPGDGAVLLDDGKLIMARALLDMRVEVFAIQTTSPGLADTAWPAHRQNNSATGWAHR